MDSHSRSASPRDPPRPQHRPPSPPPTAFDNQAYLPDEPADPNHNDSFVSSTVNGHTKEPNGDTKALEAVNLELVNLQPKNGNGKKKDVEVDMNGQNPYDEYFVPVNEHRKYMRGEKLYVTADKRGEKGGCKRPLCWTILGLIVAAVVVLIVLAATGVLFTNSPTPVEQYNSSVSSARAFGGIHVHDHGHDHDHDHDHDHHDHSQDHSSEEPQPEPQPEPNAEPEPAVEPSPVASSEHGSLQNDQQDRSTSLEAGDASLYVPRTVEGQLRVDNEDFKPGMLDADSEEYRQFSANFVSALKEALVDRGVLGSSDDDDVTIEVVDLKQGSVIVTYRIHWKPKTENAKEDLITAETLQMNLDKYLARNNRMISVYHIADDKLITRPLLDLCQANKNNCEYGCEFDETTLEFTCTCPTGQVLDMNNMKKCIQFFESENHEETVHDTKSKEVQSDHNPSNENVYDWKDVHPTIMETTTESEGDVHFSHIFGHSNVPLPEPEPTAEPKPEPEPSAEPKPEPEPTAEPKPEPEPTSEPKPEPTAEPKPEPAPTSEPEPEPQATVIPLAEPAPESASEPTSVTVPEPVAEPKPSSEPEPSSEPKPTAEPEPESVEPEYHLKPKEVVKNVELEPTAEPEPTSEPEPIIHKASVDSAPSAEPEIKSEEEADHKTDKHTHVSDPKIAINDAFYDFKYNDEDEIMSETTTTRVLVPELKEINGPFHNMPEITSMLSNIDHHINETTPISHENESQSRSFKSSVDEIMAEIYPTEIYTNKDVSSADTSDTIVKSEEESNTENEPSTSTFFPISLQKNNPSEEVSITTTAKTTASLSINKMGSDLETIMMNTEITTAEPETIYTTSQQELQVNNEETKDVMLKRIEQTHVLNSEASVQTITTEEPLEVTDVSLTHFIQDKNENQLLEVLGKKEPEKAETTTESDPSLEGMEVTFDAINMLYNRSSKVVQNKTNIKDEETTDINVSAITTDASDSDWLSEPVREINFEDSGTNTEKLAPQTESSVAITKIDEIMNKGVTKDDFEPDYLNNMSPSNKNSERDEPFYGMAHDYDSEDPRVKKRVSPKNADFTTEAFTTTIVPLKTTTISEFIYQKAESTETAEPKLTENVTEPIIQFVAKENTSDILEASTESSVEKAVTTISSQNGTQLNNLNVTIYEVPSNNDNQTNSVTKPIANTLSSEYEDHETEMNPFLPEIENNKSLVKKLQEGHDLEPVNVNETQNENIEEHTKSTKESQEIVKNSTSISVLGLNHDNSVSTTTEDVFHELIMAGNSESLEHNHEDTTSDIISSLQNTEKPEEELQTISKFLQDTDDLISSKEYTTLEPSTELEIHSEMELKSDTTSSNPEKTTIISKTSGDDDDEYLSVVPITSEKEEKDFLKKNSNSDDTYQELNDISDSRKKSDRRTFDIANPNSVINNEA